MIVEKVERHSVTMMKVLQQEIPQQHTFLPPVCGSFL